MTLRFALTRFSVVFANCFFVSKLPPAVIKNPCTPNGANAKLLHPENILHSTYYIKQIPMRP